MVVYSIINLLAFLVVVSFFIFPFFHTLIASATILKRAKLTNIAERSERPRF